MINESNQARHNQVQIGVNNSSGSTEELAHAAGVVGQGRSEGLSDPEIAEALRRESQRKAARQRILSERDEQNFRQRKFEQEVKTLRTADGEAMTTIDDQQGYRTIDTYGKKGRAKYDDEFTDEDIFQGRTDIEEGFRTEGEMVYQDDKTTQGGSYRDTDPSYLPEARIEEELCSRRYKKGGKQYTYRDKVRPQEEQANISVGIAPTSSVDPESGMVMGPMRGTIDALEKDGSPAALKLRDKILLDLDPRRQRANEREAVQRMIAADAATRDPERVQLVQAAAAAGADDMLRFNRMPGQNTTEDMVDAGIDSRPEAVLRQRGKSGEIYYTDQPITGRAEDAVPVLERSDDIDVIMRSSPNKPDSAQMQNAPRVVEAKGLRTGKGITSFIEGLGRPSGQSAAEWLMAGALQISVV